MALEGVVLIFYTHLSYHIRFINEVFQPEKCVMKLFSIIKFVQTNVCVQKTRCKKKFLRYGVVINLK